MEGAEINPWALNHRKSVRYCQGSRCWARQGMGVLSWELPCTILALVVLYVFGGRAYADRRRTSECSSSMAVSLRGARMPSFLGWDSCPLVPPKRTLGPWQLRVLEVSLDTMGSVPHFGSLLHIKMFQGLWVCRIQLSQSLEATIGCVSLSLSQCGAGARLCGVRSARPTRCLQICLPGQALDLIWIRRDL